MKQDWLEATQSGDSNLIQTLLDKGADINSFDKYGQTALMNVAVRGDLDIVKLLVEHGAELNHTAKHRLTALMLAVINHHKEVVQFLKSAGADRELGGNKGSFKCNPLQYAEDHGLDEIARILRDNT